MVIEEPEPLTPMPVEFAPPVVISVELTVWSPLFTNQPAASAAVEPPSRAEVKIANRTRHDKKFDVFEGFMYYITSPFSLRCFNF